MRCAPCWKGGENSTAVGVGCLTSEADSSAAPWPRQAGWARQLHRGLRFAHSTTQCESDRIRWAWIDISNMTKPIATSAQCGVRRTHDCDDTLQGGLAADFNTWRN